LLEVQVELRVLRQPGAQGVGRDADAAGMS
jgi:hypothetical protein